MPSDGDQNTVTWQDLTEFRTFLLDRSSAHYWALSQVWKRFYPGASTDAECVLFVCYQLKVESELKFSFPENERN